MPQFKPGQVTDVLRYQLGDHEIQYRDITRGDGLIRVEYYFDDDIDRPTMYSLFRQRMAYLQQEYGTWQTVVADSVTTMELRARKTEEKLYNPLPPGVDSKYQKGAKFDGRQWFGASTDALEEMLCIRFAGLPMNVVIICHVAEQRNEVSGEILRGPYAPGRLSSRKQLAATQQEQYYAYTQRGEAGERVHLLKTSNDGQWAAGTQIMAPDPCFPHYESLWKNWPAPRMPINVLLYGDFGVGKSQFASSFPKPMLVFMFDGKGKDLAYWKEMMLGGE